MNQAILTRGAIALALIWALVWGITTWSGAKKATPEKVESLIAESNFEDWSNNDSSSMSSSDREFRSERIKSLAAVLNRLDLRERKQLDEGGKVFDLFFKFNKEEKLQFIDLTFTKSAERLMEAFDKMEPKEREKMVDKSVQDMVNGKGAEALERLKEEDPEILDLVIKNGFKAYYQGASANTKMALLPFMDAVGEAVQGFTKPGGGGL